MSQATTIIPSPRSRSRSPPRRRSDSSDSNSSADSAHGFLKDEPEDHKRFFSEFDFGDDFDIVTFVSTPQKDFDILHVLRHRENMKTKKDKESWDRCFHLCNMVDRLGGWHRYENSDDFSLETYVPGKNMDGTNSLVSKLVFPARVWAILARLQSIMPTDAVLFYDNGRIDSVEPRWKPLRTRTV